MGEPHGCAVHGSVLPDGAESSTAATASSGATTATAAFPGGAAAAELTGLEAPPEMPFSEARLSPMAASFYGENKRVSNALVKRELGYAFRYPSYREALRALTAAGE